MWWFWFWFESLMLNSICLFVFIEVLKKMSHIAEMSSFSEIKIERYCSQTYSHFFLQYPFFLWLIYNLTFIHRQHAIWIAFTDFWRLNLFSIYLVVIAWNKCSDFVWILFFEEWHLAEVIYSSISYTFNSDYWMHVYAMFEEMQSVH